VHIGPRHDVKCSSITINIQNLPWIDDNH